MLQLADITALLLAGGQGQRMGGVDKGLQLFNGLPLAQHALQRLATQQGGPLGAMVINANRNTDAYRALGEAVWSGAPVPVLPDRVADFAGPLAGFQAGLEACRTPLLLAVPCDSPLFPLDLAQRLLHALQASDADIAVVQVPQADEGEAPVLRAQPVFCLMRTTLAPSLAGYMAGGGRKVGAWMAQHRRVDVAFGPPHDAPLAFANANSPAELRLLESL